MPVLSTAYSSYTPSIRNTSSISSLMRTHSSTSSLSSSRSSYDLNGYRPSSSYFSSSYKSSNYPSSGYYSNRISSISSSPTSVTLTKYNHRRSSVDYNDGDISTTSKSNGPVSGLVNLGNTCYMNSVLQALYSTKPLRDFILYHHETGGNLYYALSKVFKEMSKLRNSVNVSSFRSDFIHHSPKFRGYDQQDAQEFLRYLINGLHDELNKARRRTRYLTEPKSSDDAWNYYKSEIDDSKLIDLFVGQFASVITCTFCENTSTCWDPFWDLSLPIPQTRSHCDIKRCMKEFTSPEILDDDERPLCSNCKKPRRSSKQLFIKKSPPILILHLKKFANDGYKLSTQVEVNDTLTINSINYKLYACVCHHGYSSKSGHYTAYCQYDNKWFHFNDERVTDVTSSFSTSDTLNDAYLLFYQRISDSNYSSRL